MPAAVAPKGQTTFTITRTPNRTADHKTIQRLMRLEREIQNGLRRLSKRRKREDNITRQRAGGQWTQRIKMTKLVQVEKGQTFTINVTPQLVADIKSVEKFLDSKPAK
jgi:hypothetical protein